MVGCKEKRPSVGRDVVLLHQVKRGKYAPSISPFPLKLETYLRMANIPYEVDFDEPMGPKGKTPWITFNGRKMADSQLCIEFLAEHFNKDFSSHLSDEEKAAGRSMRIMAEDHLYWAIALWRWDYSKGKTLLDIEPSFPKIIRYVMPIITRRVRRQAEGHGMGRHSKEEVIEMGTKDLSALSAFLGTKHFFLGDEPTEVDCAIFGMLAQILWCMPKSPFESLINGEHSNLKDYCYRMKERFWPDWDESLDR